MRSVLAPVLAVLRACQAAAQAQAPATYDVAVSAPPEAIPVAQWSSVQVVVSCQGTLSAPLDIEVRLSMPDGFDVQGGGVVTLPPGPCASSSNATTTFQVRPDTRVPGLQPLEGHALTRPLGPLRQSLPGTGETRTPFSVTVDFHAGVAPTVDGGAGGGLTTPFPGAPAAVASLAIAAVAVAAARRRP